MYVCMYVYIYVCVSSVLSIVGYAHLKLYFVILYIGNHPWKNKFADFTKFGSFMNVFLLLFLFVNKSFY